MKFKQWFKKVPKLENIVKSNEPQYKDVEYATYKADINIVFDNNNVIHKMYQKTVNADEHPDCPIMEYIQSVFENGYITVADGKNVRTFNTVNIKEITYNPFIHIETIKELVC